MDNKYFWIAISSLLFYSCQTFSFDKFTQDYNYIMKTERIKYNIDTEIFFNNLEYNISFSKKDKISYNISILKDEITIGEGSSVSEQISINGKDLWGLKFKLKVNNEDLIGNIVSEENTINEHGVVIHTIDFKYRNEKIYGEYYYYDQKYIYNSLDGNKSFNGEIDYKTNSVKINLGNKNIRGIIKNGITLCNADIVEYEMILHQLMDIYLGYLATMYE